MWSNFAELRFPQPQGGQDDMTSQIASRSLRVACMLVGLSFASGAAAQTYYSVATGGSGGQAQIGDGLPLPIQVNRTPGGGAIGPGTLFPPLLIRVNPNPSKALEPQTGVPPA